MNDSFPYHFILTKQYMCLIPNWAEGTMHQSFDAILVLGFYICHFVLHLSRVNDRIDVS
jgi:hypothetical protein